MVEKEYIEREVAQKVLADDYAYNAAKLLDTVPIADVQEVVRCKDCNFFKIDTFGQNICVRQFNTIRMNENDFCSYGERKCGNGNG